MGDNYGAVAKYFPYWCHTLAVPSDKFVHPKKPCCVWPPLDRKISIYSLCGESEFIAFPLGEQDNKILLNWFWAIISSLAQNFLRFPFLGLISMVAKRSLWRHSWLLFRIFSPKILAYCKTKFHCILSNETKFWYWELIWCFSIVFLSQHPTIQRTCQN